MKKNYQNAFNLAEVLITLGIIGVVAAMTIGVINNIHNQELKTAFKKSYSTLSQALEQVTTDNGNVLFDCYASPSYVYNASECTAFWTNFKSKLDIIKTYNGAVDGVNLPDYTGVELIVAQGGTNRNNSCSAGKSISKNSKEAITLKDGAIIFSYSVNFYNIYGTYFIIDTNGIKKPNKWGYDLFILNFLKKSPSSSVIITDDLCGSKEQGGYWIRDILLGQ